MPLRFPSTRPSSSSPPRLIPVAAAIVPVAASIPTFTVAAYLVVVAATAGIVIVYAGHWRLGVALIAIVGRNSHLSFVFEFDIFNEQVKSNAMGRWRGGRGGRMKDFKVDGF